MSDGADDNNKSDSDSDTDIDTVGELAYGGDRRGSKGRGLSEKNPLSALNLQGWISLKGFAQIAEVSYQTANRWCHLEMIRYVQVGGQKRVYHDEIKRFAEEGTLPPNKEKFEAERDARLEYKRIKRAKHNVTGATYGRDPDPDPGPGPGPSKA